jgi:hypothetical protein
MKCWNSAFNAQGSRVIIVVVQVGPVKIYVAAVEALRKRGKTGWTSIYHQNWWKKLVWIPVIFPFVKFSFPVMGLMSYYAKTGRSRPLLLAWLYRQLMWLLVKPNTYLYGQSAQIFLFLNHEKSWAFQETMWLLVSPICMHNGCSFVLVIGSFRVQSPEGILHATIRLHIDKLNNYFLSEN